MSIPMLLAVATLAFGVWGFLLKMAVAAMPPLAAYVAFAATSLVLIPAYFLLGRAWGSKLEFPATGIAYASGAAIAVATGTVALLYAMRTRDVGEVVAVSGSYPIVTMVLGIVLLAEPVTITRVAGVAAIATGVVLVTR